MNNKVNTYFLDNFSELSETKQFHFASRLWLWNGDELAKKILQSTKTNFCGDGDLSQFDKIISRIKLNPTNAFGSKSATEERKPYFAKYPKLITSSLVLFRILFSYTIYGYDLRQSFYDHFDKQETEEMLKQLSADEQAVKVLSTHAINFIYLYTRFMMDNEDSVDIEGLIRIAESIDKDKEINILLYIYLLTHCILGESMFYKRSIPITKISSYKKIVVLIENIIEVRFTDINLDNKFEFLVCAKIVGYETRLASRIYEEAGKSFSPKGSFLIDTLNTFKTKENKNFDDSEHRNILFILSHSDYNPSEKTYI